MADEIKRPEWSHPDFPSLPGESIMKTKGIDKVFRFAIAIMLVLALTRGCAGAQDTFAEAMAGYCPATQSAALVTFRCSREKILNDRQTLMDNGVFKAGVDARTFYSHPVIMVSAVSLYAVKDYVQLGERTMPKRLAIRVLMVDYDEYGQPFEREMYRVTFDRAAVAKVNWAHVLAPRLIMYNRSYAESPWFAQEQTEEIEEMKNSP